MMQRRTFIVGSTSVAGGVLIGYQLQRPLSVTNPLTRLLVGEQFAITPYVIVDEAGVTIIAPRAEMGQGIHGTLAALVAEELDIPLADVKVEHGPASEVYTNTVAFPSATQRQEGWLGRVKRRLGVGGQQQIGTQLTGGQSSIQDGYVKMRKAGAAARAVLVDAAAAEFGVESRVLRTSAGAVVHPDGTRIPYTRLAAAAAAIDPPKDPPLKPREQWTQLGRSQPRVDMVDKCTGLARYAIDIRLPEMLFAVVRWNPRIGGGLKHFDASKAASMKGFRKAIAVDDGIVVIATNTWYAMQAAEMIEVEWGPAPYPATTAEHQEAVERAIDENPERRWRDDGDVDQALAESDVVTGSYRVPYLPHATMEPMSAVARIQDGELDIWAGNQNPTRTQAVAAKIAGIPLDSVRVHTTYMGCGFGRRLEMDFVRTAVHAALAMPATPVKVTWPREADMGHDAYRPVAAARFRGSVSNGRPVALDLKVSSPGLAASLRRRTGKLSGDVKEFLDKFSAAGAAEQPYGIENYRVTAHTAQRLLPVGWWRSVGESQNTFFHESAVDELAHAAGSDPLTMRLMLVEDAPSKAVLEAVAEMSNWGSKLPPGRARGVAYARSSGAATAQVVEVSHTSDGIRVEKSYAAVDVGIALDPRNIDAQVQSAVIFGLSAAMHGEITVSDGMVDQRNFDDYPLMRMDQAPQVQVHIHESGTVIYGVGESATPTAAPALGNAIFAATGQRVRELPFGNTVRFF